MRHLKQCQRLFHLLFQLLPVREEGVVSRVALRIRRLPRQPATLRPKSNGRNGGLLAWRRRRRARLRKEKPTSERQHGRVAFSMFHFRRKLSLQGLVELVSGSLVTTQELTGD